MSDDEAIMEARKLAQAKMLVVRNATYDVARQIGKDTRRGYDLAMAVLERVDGELAEVRILVSKLQELRPE